MERLISIFIPSLRGGGAERAMLLLGEGLIEKGFSVELLVADDSGPLRPLIAPGITLISFHTKRISRAFFPLVRYLRRKRPIALYSTIAHTNILSVLAVKVACVSTKVVIRESNVPVTEPKHSFSRKLVHHLTPYIYPLADKVISVSDGVKKELCALNSRLQDKIVVLPTPVIFSSFEQRANEPVLHPSLFDPEVPVVLGVGRLQPQKDFSNLIKAFSLVRKNQRARLVILGEGKERAALDALVQELSLEDSVSFPGFVENPFPYMKKASVFVLSSLFEGMPNVLLQAMACGTPVVATDCKSGPREILGENERGWLVPVQDSRALASAIQEALHASPRLDTPLYVRKHYGVSEAVDSYISLLSLPT